MLQLVEQKFLSLAYKKVKMTLLFRLYLDRKAEERKENEQTINRERKRGRKKSAL
jgi:hypothetical protein